MAEHAFMDEYVQPPPPPRGYSLAALFLLVTTAGIVAALARSATERIIEWKFDGEVAAHAAIGLLVGAIVGFTTAQAYPRRLQGLFLGMATGAATGAVCATVAALGASLWLYLLGALALIAMGGFARFGQRRRNRQQS
ncbi:MAG TPA: hypothetical protein VHB99_14005 [Pirellulales bacterium]|nr:hypothetical protein [Pirellulales bacterium]